MQHVLYTKYIHVACAIAFLPVIVMHAHAIRLCCLRLEEAIGIKLKHNHSCIIWCGHTIMDSVQHNSLLIITNDIMVSQKLIRIQALNNFLWSVKSWQCTHIQIYVFRDWLDKTNSSTDDWFPHNSGCINKLAIDNRKRSPPTAPMIDTAMGWLKTLLE